MFCQQHGVGGCFEPCSLVCKGKQLKASLAFPTLFIPARLVIKSKIHMPFGLTSVLSTRGCIVELLWSVPLEIQRALALSLLTLPSAVPQYLPCAHRGVWRCRGAGGASGEHRGDQGPHKPWKLHTPGAIVVIRGAGPWGLQTAGTSLSSSALPGNQANRVITLLVLTK